MGLVLGDCCAVTILWIEQQGIEAVGSLDTENITYNFMDYWNYFENAVHICCQLWSNITATAPFDLSFIEGMLDFVQDGNFGLSLTYIPKHQT